MPSTPREPVVATQWYLLDKDLVYISAPENGHIARISDVCGSDSQQVRHAGCEPVASDFTPSQTCQLDDGHIFGCSESEARIWRMGRASWTPVGLLADESWLSGTAWLGVLGQTVTPQAIVWHILAVAGTGRLVHLQLGLAAATGLARVWGTTITTQAWNCRPAVQQVVCDDAAVRVQVWSSTADGCTPSLLQYEVQCVPAPRLVEPRPGEGPAPASDTPTAHAPSSGLLSSAWSMLKDAVAVTPRGEGMGRVSSSKWIRALPKLCSQIRALLLNQPGGPLLLAACEDRAACYDTRSLLLMKLWRRRAPQVAWHYFSHGPESWAAVLMVPARRTVECWSIPACSLRGVFQALPGTQLAQVEAAPGDSHRAQALLGTVRASSTPGSSAQFAWTTAYTWRS